ncbi:MAG: TolC family protein [Myxococcaceae bacterium]
MSAARRASLAVLLLATAARAEEEDPTLTALIADALEARPELARAQAEVRGATERVPQAGAWSDPMLQVGVQNDGFTRWQVGSMQTSWVSFMASQTIPFPGKPRLKMELAENDVALRKLLLERVRLSTIAEVKRAWLALVLARSRLERLEQRAALLTQAVAAAQIRYEAGTGPQADLARARLELGRLAQQRVVLQADAQLQTAALNRLRHHPLEESVATVALGTLSFPAVPAFDAAEASLAAASPELHAAQLAVGNAERTRELGKRQYLPDLTVGAGVMVRGPLEPMWTVTLGVPVPVFAGVKQARAVSEADAAVEGASRGVDAVEQLLKLRMAQRLASWRALAAVWSSQEQLRADAQAAADATLNQFRIGQVPFTAVLEATAAVIAVLEAGDDVLVEGWRLRVAQDEASLGEVPGLASAAGAVPSAATSTGM